MLSLLLSTVLADAGVVAPPETVPDLVAAFRMRYPAFAAVDAGTIVYWLKDADRFVNDSWGDDADVGRIEYAAHNMIESGVPGIARSGVEQIPNGVTRFRSASMDIVISEAAANRAVSGGYASTLPGQRFAALLRRHNGGPRLVGYVEPVCGYGW